MSKLIDNPSASGGGTPAGSDTQVQFNDGGAFGGDAGLTYNKTTDTLTIGEKLITNTVYGATGYGSLELYGGTGAGADLFFYTTSNASKGDYYLPDLVSASGEGLMRAGGSGIVQIYTLATNKLLGRSTAGTGDVEAISIGTGLSLSAGTLSNTITDTGITQLTGDVTAGPGSGSQAATIAAGVVTDSKISSTADVMIGTITFIIDGGGSAITTGIKGDLEIPFNCTINRVTLLADQSGSIVVDIWKDTYANYPPTVADSITASAKPTITTATKSQDATLTGWTTNITAGDTLRFNVDSITTCTRVTLSLKVTKT